MFEMQPNLSPKLDGGLAARVVQAIDVAGNLVHTSATGIGSKSIFPSRSVFFISAYMYKPGLYIPVCIYIYIYIILMLVFEACNSVLQEKVDQETQGCHQKVPEEKRFDDCTQGKEWLSVTWRTREMHISFK